MTLQKGSSRAATFRLLRATWKHQSKNNNMMVEGKIEFELKR
jgi:ribosome-associated toxin RatA of RatAB toxin-antitoxin module